MATDAVPVMQGFQGATAAASSGSDYWGADGQWHPAGGGGVSDGSKGDITVSGGGTVWTIANGTVTLAKSANLATDRLIGRDTAGTGVPEAITVGGGLEFTGSGGIQSSAFTGDVTKSAGGTVLTIASNAVTFAKMQAVSANVLLGNDAVGTAVEEIACTAAGRALLDDADAAAQRTTLGLGTLATQSGTFSGTSSGTNTGDQTITLTGDVTGSGTGSFAATIAANAVTDAKFRQGSARSVVGVAGNATANTADIQGTTDQVLRITGAGTGLGFGAIDLSKAAAAGGVLQAACFPALTGDVTTSAGALAATIANNAVTNAKAADMANGTIKLRVTAGTGDPEDGTVANLLTVLQAAGYTLTQYVKMTSDQTFNSATPANVTALVFSVTSGRYYHFRFVLNVRSDTATVGVKLTLTIPGVTRFAATVNAPLTSDGAAGRWFGEITASADAVVPTSVAAANTDYIAIIEGLILPSANGSVQLQAATETGTTVVTVRQGSFIEIKDLGT